MVVVAIRYSLSSAEGEETLPGRVEKNKRSTRTVLLPLEKDL